MAVLLPKYSKMVAQYPLQFLVITPPVRIASIPIATSRLILTALINERVMVVTTNIAKGRTAAKGDSPTSVVIVTFLLLILISRVLSNAEILALESCWDWLAIVTATNIVVLRTEMVVYLGEVCLLLCGVFVAERGFPIVSEVLVFRYLLY